MPALGTRGAASARGFGFASGGNFVFTIASNQTNANLRTLAVSAGWNQSSPVIATISGGVYISSNSTGTPALTVSGSFPGGVTLVNNGIIVGMGGAGGAGSGANASPTVIAGSNGSSGGLALSVSSTISINNAGTIAGGGGGGGGGRGYYAAGKNNQSWAGSGGGGGRSSNAANSSGGAAGPALWGTPRYSATAGGAGTLSSAGSGGTNSFDGINRAGMGGSGGGWGSTGASGDTGNNGNIAAVSTSCGGPYSGGSGGGAVTGNSNITWIATGTRTGGIS